MKHLSGIIFLSISSGVLGGCKQHQKEMIKPPNILFVINDDQTYIHTGFAGSKFVHTPGFDRVAARSEEHTSELQSHA